MFSRVPVIIAIASLILSTYAVALNYFQDQRLNVVQNNEMNNNQNIKKVADYVNGLGENMKNINEFFSKAKVQTSASPSKP